MNERLPGRPCVHGHRSGDSESPTYRVWHSMLERVRGQSGTAAHKRNYHGRGISVCARWLRFENFLADMGVRPPGTSLDRINNDGPYSAENCRWATAKEQARNRRTNRLLTHKGRTLTVAEWSEITCINGTTIRYRLRKGWSVERAIEEPVHVEHRRRSA